MKPAHNASALKPVHFEGRLRTSLFEIYRTARSRPAVGLNTFSGRVNRRAKVAPVTAEVLEECLYWDVKRYHAAHARRKTDLEIGGRTVVLQDYYDALPENFVPAVSYRVFWQRVKSLQRRKLLDEDTLQLAVEADDARWREMYGGGRRVPIHYAGQDWPMMKSLIAHLGREADYRLIIHRIAKGWSLENALQPRREGGGGFIYHIRQESTGLLYFGLGTTVPEERWKGHVAAAAKPEYRLHIEMAKHGIEDFHLTPLEEYGSDEELAQAERRLIALHGTIWPNGLNGNAGGAIGGGKPKPVTHDGISYRSIGERNRILGEQNSLAPHVVARRISENKCLKAPQRRVNAKRLPDPDQQRQYLSRKRAGMVVEWEDPEAYYADVRPDLHQGLHMVRLDKKKPWGPDNFAWLPVEEKVRHVHGVRLVLGDVEYGSYAEAAAAHGMSTSTLKYRLKVNKMSMEEAVSTPLGPTAGR